jgi:hypothetical protein
MEGQLIADRSRHGEHPLPDGDVREHALDQLRGELIRRPPQEGQKPLTREQGVNSDSSASICLQTSTSARSTPTARAPPRSRIEMLTDEAQVDLHACLTPIWSETACFADYVLPTGHASERHDLMRRTCRIRPGGRGSPPGGRLRGAGHRGTRIPFRAGLRRTRPGRRPTGARPRRGADAPRGGGPLAPELVG